MAQQQQPSVKRQARTAAIGTTSENAIQDAIARLRGGYEDSLGKIPLEGRVVDTMHPETFPPDGKVNTLDLLRKYYVLDDHYVPVLQQDLGDVGNWNAIVATIAKMVSDAHGQSVATDVIRHDVKRRVPRQPVYEQKKDDKDREYYVLAKTPEQIGQERAAPYDDVHLLTVFRELQNALLERSLREMDPTKIPEDKRIAAAGVAAEDILRGNMQYLYDHMNPSFFMTQRQRAERIAQMADARANRERIQREYESMRPQSDEVLDDLITDPVERRREERRKQKLAKAEMAKLTKAAAVDKGKAYAKAYAKYAKKDAGEAVEKVPVAGMPEVGQVPVAAGKKRGKKTQA